MKPLLIAHRGLSAHYPENTVLSFEKAIEAGAKWIELDVHTCATGELVVVHDDNLQRTTGAHGYIHEMSLEEIQSKRILYNGVQTEQRIETLDHILTKFSSAGICIELKGLTSGQVLSSLIKNEEHLFADCEIIISSFKKNIIEELTLPDSTMKKAVTVWGTPSARELDAYAAFGATALHIDWNDQDISKELVSECHARGMEVWAYTVNDPETARTLLAYGCDALFTDDFPLLASMLH